MYHSQNIYCLSVRAIIITITLFICESLHAESEHPGYSISPPENWVKEQALPQTRANSPTQSEQYLLIDRQFNLTNSTQKRYYRSVSKPLTTDGLTDASQIKVVYNENYETVTFHKIVLIRNNKERDILNKASPRFLQQEPESDNLIHTGLTTVLFNIPDVRKGDIIDVSYTFQGFNPVLGSKPFGTIQLSWDVSVDNLSIRLISDSALKTKLFNTSIQLKTINNKSTVEHIYTDKDTTPVQHQGDYPHGVSPYGKLQYSGYRNWAEVSSWANEVYSDINTTIAVKQISKQLSQTSKSTEDYILNSISFVQEEIRYLGLELNENTHLPRNSDDIIQTRYGDCKDKASLIYLLLKEKNIESYPALVNTQARSTIKDYLPSPGAFDHVINKIIFQDKEYWVDGTRTYQGHSLDKRGKTDYGYSLLIRSHINNLVQMYTSPPVISHIKIMESFNIESFSKPIVYEVKTEYSGSDAEHQRYRFSNKSLEKIASDYLNFYNNYYKDIQQTRNIEVYDDIRKNTFTTIEKYKIKSLLSKEGDYYKIPINITFFEDYLVKPKSNKRSLPQRLGPNVSIENSFTIIFPEEIYLNLDTSTHSINSNGYEYSYTDKYQSKKYVHTAKLDIKSNQITPNELDQYIKNRERLVDNWYFTINFKNPSAYMGYREIIKLKNRLNELKGFYND
ncbi:DUF3857 domain-containing protein [Teredinibacter sp. KSP-S5-2]|uniref:DUF3857 domain-containing protein n=1 Tax=Teredinibacter sp. KSP-S5-2 TaxID=3034506 RepID=UPI00293434A2|nr:DUF3857 domain-containing protein [Teredinibacter sp. KSP-S5-2]WNO08898.1 DUF3857 domain-containing protein [Teredinibacter sp. KSP-S5-2]